MTQQTIKTTLVAGTAWPEQGKLQKRATIDSWAKAKQTDAKFEEWLLKSNQRKTK